MPTTGLEHCIEGRASSGVRQIAAQAGSDASAVASRIPARWQAADASGEEQVPRKWHGTDLSSAPPEEMEAVLADTVLKEFKVRLARIGIEYQTPSAP